MTSGESDPERGGCALTLHGHGKEGPLRGLPYIVLLAAVRNGAPLNIKSGPLCNYAPKVFAARRYPQQEAVRGSLYHVPLLAVCDGAQQGIESEGFNLSGVSAGCTRGLRARVLCIYGPWPLPARNPEGLSNHVLLLAARDRATPSRRATAFCTYAPVLLAAGTPEGLSHTHGLLLHMGMMDFCYTWVAGDSDR